MKRERISRPKKQWKRLLATECSLIKTFSCFNTNLYLQSSVCLCFRLIASGQELRKATTTQIQSDHPSFLAWYSQQHVQLPHWFFGRFLVSKNSSPLLSNSLQLTGQRPLENLEAHQPKNSNWHSVLDMKIVNVDAPIPGAARRLGVGCTLTPPWRPLIQTNKISTKQKSYTIFHARRTLPLSGWLWTCFKLRSTYLRFMRKQGYAVVAEFLAHKRWTHTGILNSKREARGQDQ